MATRKKTTAKRKSSKRKATSKRKSSKSKTSATKKSSSGLSPAAKRAAEKFGVKPSAVPSERKSPEVKETKSKAKAVKVLAELSDKQRLLLKHIAKSKTPQTIADLKRVALSAGYTSMKGWARLVSGANNGTSMVCLGLLKRTVVEGDDGRSALAVEATKLGRDAAKYIK